MTRVLFLGTSEFAVPALEALARLARRGAIELVGAVTRPDRPGHRGRIAPPPLKVAAERLHVAVLQPERLRDRGLDLVLALRPEALVWAAYGALIPAELIGAAGGSALNVHPSLLPRWRGAAPIARAIVAGDPVTGVTLMQGTAEMDAGPIVAQEATPIGPNETRGELEARLAGLGAELLERELPRYLRGEAHPIPQDGAQVTWAHKLDPREGELDPSRPAEELARLVRAYTPEPGAYTFYRGARLGVLRASVAGGPPAAPGTLRTADGAPEVAAAGAWLRLDLVQPAGKRRMTGADWARGRRDLLGGRLPS